MKLAKLLSNVAASMLLLIALQCVMADGLTLPAKHSTPLLADGGLVTHLLATL